MAPHIVPTFSQPAYPPACHSGILRGMQHYIGVKKIEAWPALGGADGSQDGYAVKYRDDYTSWSPKDVFEKAYLPMGEGSDGTRITAEMVEAFISSLEYQGRSGNHGVFLVTLANGFTLIEESACVDPANFDEAIAYDLVLEKVKRRVWHMLGFLLAHARNGLTVTE